MTNIEKYARLSEESLDRVIGMAWEDRTPFEAIKNQFDLSESDVITLMRKTLKRSSFNLWRKRVNSGVSNKHLMKQPSDMNRFKCTRQRAITGNRISKRKHS
ncbi:MAG: TIGR03643 family protein [Flavobacteriales bacterium]|nr:TIGR03643 family protein [Flavobacteriales bacterium]